MRVYLDASVLIALITADALTSRADAFLRTTSPVLILSDFAAAEFVSAIGRRVRMGDISKADARSAFSTLDVWAVRATERIETTAADVKTADAFLRRLDLTLRTPDALNIALAKRSMARLATFDKKMAVSAKDLLIEVVSV